MNNVPRNPQVGLYNIPTDTRINSRVNVKSLALTKARLCVIL